MLFSSNGIRTSVIQVEVNFDKKEQILNQIEPIIDECININSQLICLPELFASPFTINNLDEVSESIPGYTTDFLCKQAIKGQVYIAAGLLETNINGIFNSAVLINPQGDIIGIHRKLCLNSFERNFIRSGDSIKVYNTNIGKIGLLVGNDLNSFEVCQFLVDSGVEIVICMVQIPEEFAFSFESIAESRAIDMDAFIIIASNVGYHSLARTNFKGLSRILCNPLLLGKGSNRNEIVVAQIRDKEKVLSTTCNVQKLNKSKKYAFNPNREKIYIKEKKDVE